jgi:hypothetical protein
MLGATSGAPSVGFALWGDRETASGVLKENHMGIEEELVEKRYPGSTGKTERNQEIRKLHKGGVGVLRLGRRFRISPAPVKQILDAQRLKRS